MIASPPSAVDHPPRIPNIWWSAPLTMSFDIDRKRRCFSLWPLPAIIIGYTFSDWSVMKSMNTHRSFIANASFNAPSTSAGLSMRMPT